MSVCISRKSLATHPINYNIFFLRPSAGLIKELTGSYNPLLYSALAHGLLAVVTVVGVVCCTPKSRAA